MVTDANDQALTNTASCNQSGGQMSRAGWGVVLLTMRANERHAGISPGRKRREARSSLTAQEFHPALTAPSEATTAV